MRLLRSATRPQAVECFFCLSASLLPPRQTVDINGKGKGREISPVGTEWNWRCERCGCWNIRDQQGEMMSDLPAMHNPEAAVNRAAFSLRARPSSSHIPSGPSTSPFCRSCTSNQVLIMNMLANYLPEESDPTFGPLYDRLPDYLANLHHRYPPVCPACQPTVDAALKKADHRAQSEAWGFALKKGETSRRGGEGAISGPSRLAVMVWRLRGLLFCAGFVMSSTQGALATFQSRRLDRLGAEQRSNDSSLGWAPVCFHLLSIMWIAWDPYWLRVRRMGGQAKVTGRRVWVRNMLAILVIRLVSSSSALLGSNTISRITQAGWGLEIALLLYSLLSIRIAQPVSLSLVRPTSTQSSSHPTPSRVLPSSTSAPVVDLSALSLNYHPLPNFQANPIFGQSSLQPLPNPAENDSMDWEPLPLTTKSTPDQWLDEADEGGGKADWNGFGIGKQRMFPQAHGTDETGLESLLAGWGLGGPQENASPSLRRNNSRSAVPQTSSGIARYHRAIGITLASLRFAGLAVMGLTSMSALNPNVKVFSSTTAHWTISALELANNVAKLIGDVPRLGLRDGKAGDIIPPRLAIAVRVLLAFGMPRLLEYVDITAITGDWRTYTIWILCGALTLGRL